MNSKDFDKVKKQYKNLLPDDVYDELVNNVEELKKEVEKNKSSYLREVERFDANELNSFLFALS